MDHDKYFQLKKCFNSFSRKIKRVIYLTKNQFNRSQVRFLPEPLEAVLTTAFFIFKKQEAYYTSWSDTLNDPFIIFGIQQIFNTIVQTIRLPLPKFKLIRFKAVATPKGGIWN